MKTPVGILFDLDGTVLDTAPEFATCLNEFLRAQNKTEITVQALRPYVSKGARGMCKFGFPELDNEQFETIVQSFLARYLQGLGQQTQLFVGIVEMIQTLVQNHIPWGIVTNKHERFALPLIKQFAALSSVGIVVGGDTTPEPKPSPRPLLHAATALNLTASHCWYIGDAKSDVDASKAAGMRCAIANYGYLPPDEDAKYWQADTYIDTPQDLLQIILD